MAPNETHFNQWVLILSLRLFSSQMMWEYVTNTWVRALSTSVNWSCCYCYYMAEITACMCLQGWRIITCSLPQLYRRLYPHCIGFKAITLTVLVHSTLSSSAFYAAVEMCFSGSDIELLKGQIFPSGEVPVKNKTKKKVNIWPEAGGDHTTLMSAVAALHLIDV